MFICIHAFIINMNVYIHIYIYKYTKLPRTINRNIYIYIYIHMFRDTYTQKCIYTCIRTYI